MFLLFLLILVVSFFGVSYFTNIISTQKKQIVILTKQNNDLRSKMGTVKIPCESLVVKYYTPDSKNGILSEDCNLYISPLEGSAILSRLYKNVPIIVLDSAKISNILWYEISLPNLERINTKGWVKNTCIELIIPVEKKETLCEE